MVTRKRLKQALVRQLKVEAMLGAILLLALAAVIHYHKPVSADCAAVPTDRGAVTSTITVPANGTYRIWGRMMAPDTTNNSYYLQINQTTCGVVVGDSSTIPVNAWTWVDYQNGAPNAPIDVTLTAGAHTVKMIGREDGVEVDRVIATQDINCIPTGTGDNCANPADTTPPVVSLTAPADGATLSSPTTTVTAAATDNVAVTKVEFYLDGALASTTTLPPYTYSLAAASLSPGNHTLMAKAYDAAGNSTSSATITVKAPDAIAPAVSITGPANGATLKGTVALQANAGDNIGVTKAELYLGSSLAQTFTGSGPYSFNFDSTKVANGTVVNITYKAYDAAGNVGSQKVSATVDNSSATPPPPADTTPPNVSLMAPAAGTTLSGTASLAATATDNTAVTNVEFYVDGALKASTTNSPYAASIDTTLLANGAHSLTAKAYDAAGNSKTSSAVSVTVNNHTYLPEDINEDGHVDLLDFSILSSKFGQTSNLGRADINHDGVINLLDFSLLASKFGQ